MAKDRSLLIAIIGICVLAVVSGIVFNATATGQGAARKILSTPCKTYTTEYNGAWHVAWTCASGDQASCAKNDMCVYQGICYANRYDGVFPGKTADKYAICAGDQDHKWFDVDGGESQCLELNKRFPGLTQWAMAGEQNVEEYYNDANGGTGNFPYECCGDDEGEYSVSGMNGTSVICCNSPNDLNINGVCTGQYPTACKTYKTEYNGAWHVAWQCSSTNSIGCDQPNMCVYKGVCYANRNIGVFYPGNSQDQIVVCAGDQDHKWFDADGGKSQCLEINKKFPGMAQWAMAGEQVGEYYNDANGGAGNFPYECCGDDAGEYPITTGNAAAPYICCGATDKIASLNNGVWECKNT